MKKNSLKKIEKETIKKMKVGLKVAVIYIVLYLLISFLLGFIIRLLFSLVYPNIDTTYVFVVVILLSFVIIYSIFRIPKTVCCDC